MKEIFSTTSELKCLPLSRSFNLLQAILSAWYEQFQGLVPIRQVPSCPPTLRSYLLYQYCSLPH